MTRTRIILYYEGNIYWGKPAITEMQAVYQYYFGSGSWVARAKGETLAAFLTERYKTIVEKATPENGMRPPKQLWLRIWREPRGVSEKRSGYIQTLRAAGYRRPAKKKGKKLPQVAPRFARAREELAGVLRRGRAAMAQAQPAQVWEVARNLIIVDEV